MSVAITSCHNFQKLSRLPPTRVERDTIALVDLLLLAIVVVLDIIRVLLLSSIQLSYKPILCLVTKDISFRVHSPRRNFHGIISHRHHHVLEEASPPRRRRNRISNDFFQCPWSKKAHQSEHSYRCYDETDKSVLHRRVLASIEEQQQEAPCPTRRGRGRRSGRSNDCFFSQYSSCCF
jgi:hypothetical protein